MSGPGGWGAGGCHVTDPLVLLPLLLPPPAGSDVTPPGVGVVRSARVFVCLFVCLFLLGAPPGVLREVMRDPPNLRERPDAPVDAE
jgi:hypothetical protein